MLHNHTYVHVYIHTWFTHIHKYMYIYIHQNFDICTYTDIYVYICTYICRCFCVYIYIYMYNVCIPRCIYIYICMSRYVSIMFLPDQYADWHISFWTNLPGIVLRHVFFRGSVNINASMTVHVRCTYTYKFYLLVLVVRDCMILERQELFGSGLKHRDVIGRLSSFKHML